MYAAWETDEVIGFELWRNLGLAAVCVFVITLLLLADLKICCLVLLCVVLTLVRRKAGGGEGRIVLLTLFPSTADSEYL